MLGKYITQWRKERGMTCTELARQSGHPVSSIHGIERGANKNPHFRIIIDISNVLQVSLDDMQKAFDEKE